MEQVCCVLETPVVLTSSLMISRALSHMCGRLYLTYAPAEDGVFGSVAECQRAYAIMNCLLSLLSLCVTRSPTHTISPKSSFFTCNGIIMQLYVHESSFLHVLGISALKLVLLQLAYLKTSGCAEFGPLNTKESDFSPKYVSLRNRSSYSFETCTIVISTPENLSVHWVWPSKKCKMMF